MLRAGDPAPDFTLRNPFDVEVSLRDALEHSAIVLEFVRGTWDPDSRTRIAALAAEKLDLVDLGARSLVVTCERPDDARRFIETSEFALSLLVDRDREASRAYGVYKRFWYGAFGVARPATFVIDRCAFVRYAHVARAPIDSAELGDVVRVLGELRSDAQRGV